MKIINGLKLYDAKELAKMFDVSLITISKLRRNGLRSVKLGHKVYTSEETIREYLNGLIDVKKKAQGVTIDEDEDDEAGVTLEQVRATLIDEQLQAEQQGTITETYTIAAIHLLRSDVRSYDSSTLSAVATYNGHAKFWSKNERALYAIVSSGIKNVNLFTKDELIDLFNNNKVVINLGDAEITFTIVSE